MVMAMTIMTDMHRRPQVGSWVCEFAASRGTARPTVHFKRSQQLTKIIKIMITFVNLTTITGGQVHWQKGGRREVSSASWNLLHGPRTTPGWLEHNSDTSGIWIENGRLVQMTRCKYSEITLLANSNMIVIYESFIDWLPGEVTHKHNKKEKKKIFW